MREKYKIGDKIVAVVRHCNSKLNLKDKTLVLTVADDSFYIDDGPDELSLNWDIISYEVINETINF